MHYACKKANLELIKLLIDNEADLLAEDNIGRTPLIYTLLSENM